MGTEGIVDTISDGTLTEDQMASALLSDEQIDVDAVFGTAADEDSSTSEPEVKADDVKDADADVTDDAVDEKVAADAKDDSDADADADSDEQFVETKDGKHRIPYSVLEEARNGEKEALKRVGELEAKLKDQVDLEESVAAAQEADEQAGTTDAVDELLADLEESNPEIVEGVKALLAKDRSASQKSIDDLRTELDKLKEAFEPVKETSEIQNRKSHFTQIEEAHSDFDAIMATDAEGPLHDFLESQPSFTKALYNDILDAKNGQGTAEQVIELLTTFKDATGYGKPEDSVEPEPAKPKGSDGKEAAEKAKAEASAKKATPKSLSDVPAGSTPVVDEAEAILTEANPLNLMDKLANKTPEQVEALLAKAGL